MVVVKRISALAITLIAVSPTIHGFVSHSFARQLSLSQPQTLTLKPPSERLAPNIPCRTETSLRVASLWDRLEIDEDDEPHWYLLNCVAGLELDLLGQCRERCTGMEGVVKFVAPMESLTRSHGASRMLTEHKTKYPGYVFAKLRLCAENYNAIQDLDLCRSWMGNVNYKRSKKLPPAPIALNEVEIEGFGLETIQEGNERGDEDSSDDNDIIHDTEEQDIKDNKPRVNEEQLKDFLGLKVDDMIKVTGKNKFHGEDGIIKRLKGGKVMIRFYTYGSTYDEWLEPQDVRKLGDDEVLRGLAGPTKPITQQEFDGGGEGFTDSAGQRGGGPGRNLRNDLMSTFDGGRGDRNRRVDRIDRGDNFKRDLFGRSDDERKREDRNWKQYQNQQQADKPVVNDGEWSLRSGSQKEQAINDADVDGQWGRYSQKKQRNERPVIPPKNIRQNRDVNNAIDGDDDWSKFVSPSSSPSSASSGKDDDFFSSLMNELSDDLDQKNSKKDLSQNVDDDFFASLMSELTSEVKQNISPPQKTSFGNDVVAKKEDDFFAALEAELGTFDSQGLLDNNGADDFFSNLEAEMKTVRPKSADASNQSSDDNVDFFAALESEMAASKPIPAMSGTDIASFDEIDVGAVFGSESGEPPVAKNVKEERPNDPPLASSHSSKGIKPKSSPMTSSSLAGDLGKCTVPVLKSMLKERGLKMTGNKSELIERLQEAS